LTTIVLDRETKFVKFFCLYFFLSSQAAVTLRQLLMSNEKIVSKLVNEELMDRFRALGESTSRTKKK
jgi:hypothetical protein